VQPGQGTLELVGFLDVVLVGIGKVVGLDVGAAGQRQEVGGGAFGGAAVDGQAVFAPMGLELFEDGLGVVGRAIVITPDGRARMALGGNRVELLRQEVPFRVERDSVI
jgi:hypothetical protein